MYKPLHKMLDELSETSEFIKSVNEKVEITFHISSESGQIGFEIPDDILKKIIVLNISLWIEIFIIWNGGSRISIKSLIK